VTTEPLLKFIADIDQAELACRMIEAVSGGKFKRPPEITALQAIACLQEEDRSRWFNVARTAMQYFKETSLKADTLTEISAKFTYETEIAELACRCIETASDGKYKRPEGLTAIQAISCLQSEDQKKWLCVAQDAVNYVSECVAKATLLQ
jgi:hypothetical protein